MLEQIKWYLVNVGIRKYGPVGIAAGFAAIGSYLAAHAGMLEQYGITYGVWPLTWPAGQDPSGPCILIEMDTLSAASYTAIIALVAVIVRAAQHHTTGNTTLAGGQQASDPPKTQETPK